MWPLAKLRAVRRVGRAVLPLCAESLSGNRSHGAGDQFTASCRAAPSRMLPLELRIQTKMQWEAGLAPASEVLLD